MLTMEQIKRHRVLLGELSSKPFADGETQREAERRLIAQWRDFVPDKAIGRQICESFTDEELIAILQDAFARLGRAPVQNDIFCFYRTYVKHRFITWSAALKAAGLSRALDHRIDRLTAAEYEKIEREERQVYILLIRLSERWTELGYPPGRKEFSESETLKQRFGNWSTALHAAEGLELWQQSLPEAGLPTLSEEEEAFLREIRETAGRLRRTPLKTEIREKVRWRLRVCFGSWDSVIREAGLTPLTGEALEYAEWDARQRQKGKELLFPIADLEPEYRELLDEIRTLSKMLGRAPLKEEVDPDKRRKLQERCGSWRNALYQTGVAAPTKQETARIKKIKRVRKNG